MCGIVGYTGVQSAAPILLDGLKKLEYRGYDSAGVAVMDQNVIAVHKVRGRIAALCEKIQDGAAVPGFTGIGHTRWATHGAPTEENAHPHLSNDGRFAVVHNGIIENYLPLREELIREGYHFQSETDTEVIVHLMERYYKGNVRQALIKTANRLQGSYALGGDLLGRAGQDLCGPGGQPSDPGDGGGGEFLCLRRDGAGEPLPQRHLSGGRRVCGALKGIHPHF